MIKIICIDASPRAIRYANIYLKYLIEGRDYEVEFELEDSYKLKGVDKEPGCVSINPYPTFSKDRFIRSSSISETEMERNYNELLITK